MKHQPHRLPADPQRPFGRTLIDRQRPLRFRLDGRWVHGFAGDTVLSALLANGIDTVGLHNGVPVALTSRCCPPVYRHGDPARLALPMAQLPATDGAVLHVLPPRRSWGGRRSLGCDLRFPLTAPPVEPTAAREQPDLVVVGGGIAGMSAALAGAKTGQNVLLIEQTSRLGGVTALFGRQDGEAAPEIELAALGEKLAASPAISVWLRATALALDGTSVIVQRLALDGDNPRLSLERIAAKRIVLAPGALEQRPIFAGNRLPGVTTLLEAWRLAHDFGVWPGRSALFATSANPAYRLAMLARDHDILVPRILDTRPAPQSRFIAFSKAYGITQTSAELVTEARLLAKSQLGVNTASSLRTDGGEQQFTADRLVLCGGWQPDLTLWHMAGGASIWNDAQTALHPTGTVPNVAVAGAAAGWLSRQACRQSGADAVAALLSRARKPVTEALIDPTYETADAAPSLAPLGTQATAPAYLSDGTSLLVRPAPPAPGRWHRRAVAPPALIGAPTALALTDVVAGVHLGMLPADAAGAVAQERGMVPQPAATAAPEPMAPPATSEVPAYLHGRWPNAHLWWILAEGRRLTPGALIYANSAPAQPGDAVGVVLRQTADGAVALIADEHAGVDAVLSLHDARRTDPIMLIDRVD